MQLIPKFDSPFYWTNMELLYVICVPYCIACHGSTINLLTSDVSSLSCSTFYITYSMHTIGRKQLI